MQTEGFSTGKDQINLANTTLIITTVLVIFAFLFFFDLWKSGLFQMDPFVIKTREFEKYKNEDNNAKFEGYCIDLIELLAKKMDNFDYIIRLSADGKYGAPDNGGVWDGMIGELISGVSLTCPLATILECSGVTRVYFSESSHGRGSSHYQPSPRASRRFQQAIHDHRHQHHDQETGQARILSLLLHAAA